MLRLKPGSLPATPASALAADPAMANPVPTLDAFRDDVDSHGCYSEAELLALYRDAWSLQSSSANPRTDRKLARNARLRQRQADALTRMERALIEESAPDHPLDGWFEPALAARLAAAGLATLADLLALIQRRRQRWYTNVPQLGPKGAQRIDLPPANRASRSLVKFVFGEEDEHEKALFRRANHRFPEGSRGRCAGKRAVQEARVQ
ncbi:phage integrase family protein [Mycetohabitans rhizoxinica]|uniref:phage integrase family protein n=1 Tax=Mycetohabitans rhizoxinica TaxID=412963 RepID=UPI0030CBEBE1